MFTNWSHDFLEIWPYPWVWMKYRHRHSSLPRWERIDSTHTDSPLRQNYNTFSTFRFMDKPQAGRPLPPYLGHLILDIPPEKTTTPEEAISSINTIISELGVTKADIMLSFMDKQILRLQITFTHFLSTGFRRNDTLRLYALLVDKIRQNQALNFIQNSYHSDDIYDYFYYQSHLIFDWSSPPYPPYDWISPYPLTTFPAWISEQNTPRAFIAKIRLGARTSFLATCFKEILKSNSNNLGRVPPSTTQEARHIWNNLTTKCVLLRAHQSKKEMKPIFCSLAARFSDDVAEAILMHIDASEFKWGAMKKAPIDCAWLKATFGDCKQNCGVNSPVELVHTVAEFAQKPLISTIAAPYEFKKLPHFSGACHRLCEEFKTNLLVAACMLTLITLSLLAGKLRFRDKKDQLIPVSLNLVCVREGDKLPAWNFANIIINADISTDVVPPEKQYFTTASTPVALFKELARNPRRTFIPDLEGKLFKQLVGAQNPMTDLMRLLLNTQKGKTFSYNRTKIPNRCLNLVSFIPYHQAVMFQSHPSYSNRHFRLNTLIVAPFPNAHGEEQPTTCSLQDFRDRIATLVEATNTQQLHEIPHPFEGQEPNFKLLMAYAITFYETGELKEPTPEALSVAEGFSDRYTQQIRALSIGLSQEPYRKIANRISAQVEKQNLLYFHARNMQNALGNVTKQQLDCGIELLVEQGELAPVHPLCKLPGRSAYGELYMVNKNGPRKKNPLTGDIGELLLKNTIQGNK